jgi:hypothetical protein
MRFHSAWCPSHRARSSDRRVLQCGGDLRILSPFDRSARLSHWPCAALSARGRWALTLAWAPVENASAYTVEIVSRLRLQGPVGQPIGTRARKNGAPESDLRRGCHPDPSARAARARVWAVDSLGHEGTKSDWCVTAFSDTGLPTPRSESLERDHRRSLHSNFAPGPASDCHDEYVDGINIPAV